MKHTILSGDTKPKLPPLAVDAIPATLKPEPRWVRWKWAKKHGKYTKVPLRTNGNAASSTDSGTWNSFDKVIEAVDIGDGVGFVLGDNFAGIDLDDCRNPETSELTPFALEILEAVPSYAEVSPSGTGIKIYIRGSLPEGSKTKGKGIEVYGHKRYFCVTGQRINDFDVEDCQEQLLAVHAQYVDPPKPEKKTKPKTANVNYILLYKMTAIKAKDGESDGSSRLFAWACRAIEQNVSDDVALTTFREAEKQCPFPREWTDAEFFTRLRDAEDKVERGSGRPVITLGTDFPRSLEQAIAALSMGDTYQANGRLIRVDHQPEPCDYDLFDNGSPRLALLPRGSVVESLTKVADFQRRVEKGWIECLPTDKLEAAVFHRGFYPGVKVLHSVLPHPLLLPNGEIVTTPGYHDAGVYLDIRDNWPKTMPTPVALASLRDIYAEFDFTGDSYSANLAALFSLAARHLIRGNVPMFAVDGNKSRVGKGLLTDTWTMIVEGRRASRYTLTNEDELRKYLVSIAISGRPYVCFDNVKCRIGGPVLEAAMTAGTVSGRILGLSQDVDLALKIVWFATMNGGAYTKDMNGRVCPIMLDTDALKPEERKFKYKDLLGHIEANRHQLFMAVLSVLSEYLRVGRKPELMPLGGFEDWSSLIRGCLVWAGLPDPLGMREVLADVDDDDTTLQAKRLLDAWRFDRPVSIREAMTEVRGDAATFIGLQGILDGRDDREREESEYLGNLLRRVKGRVVDGRCLTNNGTTKPKWFVKAA